MFAIWRPCSPDDGCKGLKRLSEVRGTRLAVRRRVGRRRKIVVPGKVWATDRRTTRRYFLFRPDEQRKVEKAFWYCLGVHAKRHGIEVHAATLMSTHVHLVYTDVRGVQPLFKRDFHRDFARCIKALVGWPEEVFNKAQGGEHEPVGEAALVEALAYAIGNPPEALAVRYAKDWPGPIVLPRDIGCRVICVRRPEVYFAPDNSDWPEELELKIEMPGALSEAHGDEGARRVIGAQVSVLEGQALAKSKMLGVAFQGARRVQRTPHTARAHGYEVFGKINPRFSTAGDRELAKRKADELRAFDESYDQALARWTEGDRRVQFPYGTWWMRVHHGARVRPPPS